MLFPTPSQQCQSIDTNNYYLSISFSAFEILVFVAVIFKNSLNRTSRCCWCSDKTHAADDDADAVAVVFDPAAAESTASECQTCQRALVGASLCPRHLVR